MNYHDVNTSLIRLRNKYNVIFISLIGLFKSSLNKKIMEDVVKQRIRSFVKDKSLSLNQISKDTGYPQSNLNKQINLNTSVSLSTIIVLLDYFSDLSAEWLLRGEGEMLKSNTPQDSLDTLLPLLDQRDKRIRDLEIENTLLKAKLGINEERDKLKKDTEVA